MWALPNLDRRVVFEGRREKYGRTDTVLCDLMASVGYAVIKNAPGAARFTTAHIQHLAASTL